VAVLAASTCSFSTSAHLSRTAATLGNAWGWKRASHRIHKSVKNAAVGDGSFLISKPTPLAGDDVHERVSHRTKPESG
jgi:hypothetical protein